MSDCKELSHRRFLSAVVSTAAVSRLPVTGAAILTLELTPALAQYAEVSASVEASQTCQVDVHWDKVICASHTFPAKRRTRRLYRREIANNPDFNTANANL